jgi:high affinity Mn2+ porin
MAGQSIRMVPVLLMGLLVPGTASVAQTDQPPEAKNNAAEERAGRQPPPPYQFNWQATLIVQSLFPFHSPYAGPNSLRSRREAQVTETDTLFLGARITRHSEIYLNPEWALGQGISGGLGLGSYSNADLIGPSSLRIYPYIARLNIRWRTATGKGAPVEPTGRVIARTLPFRRIIVVAGRLAASDVFDANTYANDPRTQFMNKALSNNVAWDFAQDARGYTNGLALIWVNPPWALRVGSFQMPASAGGLHLSGDLLHNRGDQIQFDRKVRVIGGRTEPATLRLLAYRNLAHMGRYRAALAQARITDGPPDITAVGHEDAVKYGFGLNFEQALADGGATGLFGRWGWNDGATESFAYSEADRTFSLGGQLSGARWKRPDDRWGLAFAQNGLSAAHRDYLAAGGLGFVLGDGRLRYGTERMLEIYYAYQLSKLLALSLDYQAIQNPGFNRDRGPVSVLSLRLHAQF